MIGWDESKIRDRAYGLWQEAGEPAGRNDEFWHRAKRELAEEDSVDSSEENSEIAPPPVFPGLIAQ